MIVLICILLPPLFLMFMRDKVLGDKVKCNFYGTLRDFKMEYLISTIFLNLTVWAIVFMIFHHDISLEESITQYMGFAFHYILLAVCMSLETSGEQVAAATTIKFGDYSDIVLSNIGSYTPESLQLSEVGDVMEEASSGGSFVIDKENSASGITDYFSFSEGTAVDGTTTYYTLATLNKALPVDYKAIQISGSSPLQNC